MAEQAKLYIEPTVLPTARRDLENLRRSATRFARDQVQGLRKGARSADGLARGYDRVTRSVGRVGAGLRGVLGQVNSLKAIGTGIVLGGAGKTIIDATIGADSKVKKSQALLRLLVKDTEKYNKANKAATELVQEVSSLDFASSIGGVEKAYTLAGGNLSFAKQLVKVGKALEQLDPSQGFEGAMFALKELESGDTTSLKGRFGIKLPGKVEAEKAAKKAKKTVKQYYFDEVIKFIDKRYGPKGGAAMSGINALLKVDRESTSGRIGMIKTAWSDVFRTIGSEANNELGKGVVDLQKEINKLHADPQFKKDVKVIAKDFAAMTKSVVSTTAKLPGMYKGARKFASENSTALKVGGGLYLANKASGGRLVSGGANLLRRGLFGKAGGGALGKAMGAVGGGMPVYVTNAHEIGAGGPLPGVGKGAGAGAASVAGRGFLGSVASKGLIGTLGVGGTAVGGGMLGTLAFAAYTFADATERTQKVTESFDKKAAQLEQRASERRQERIKRQAKQLADAFTMPFEQRLKQREEKLLRGLASNVQLSRGGQEALGTIRALLGSRQGKARQEQLKRINTALANTGVQVGLNRGRLSFNGTNAVGMEHAARLQNMRAPAVYNRATRQMALMQGGMGLASIVGQGLQSTTSQSATLQQIVNLTIQGNVDQQTARKTSDMVAKSMKDGMKKARLTR